MLTRTKTIAAICAAAVAGGGAGAGVYAALDSPAAQQSAAPVTRQTTPAAATASTLSVNEIYDRAGPGTVEITSTTTGTSSSPTPFPFGQGQGQGQQESQAQGSGFVYDTAGHIVTNEHVVDGASSFKVRFQSGRTVTATLVGSDPSTDLAVLKVSVSSDQLHPVPLGDSSKVEVGDGVVAIGSPFGLENTVTSGIVSALHRKIQAPNNFTIDDAIQTDAAINHGNSGGPLLDLHGNVIGVNAQIDSESGGNDGVGFAIPSNTVESIVSKLIANGSVQHAYLGVTIEPAAGGGVAVAKVNPGTPAAKAGLRAGDRITQVDGKDVTSDQLRAAIDAKKPGDTVKITYQRNDQTHTVTVTLAARPS
jgi:putative serine protease PepD